MVNVNAKNHCLTITKRLAREQDIPQIERDIQAEKENLRNLEDARRDSTLSSKDKRDLTVRIANAKAKIDFHEKRIETVKRYESDLETMINSGDITPERAARRIREIRLDMIKKMHVDIGKINALKSISVAMADVTPANMMKAVRDSIEARASLARDIKPLMVPIQNIKDARLKQRMGRLMGVLKNAERRKLGLIVEDNKEFQQNVMAEMHGLNTGDSEAKRAAAEINAMWDEDRAAARGYGTFIGDEPNYFPQTHDILKITKDYQHWREFMSDNLDPLEYDDIGSFLDEMMASINNGQGHTVQNGVKIYGGRKVVFKSAAAAMEYHNKFGSGTPLDIIIAHTRRLSDIVAYGEGGWGPDPFAMMRQVIDDAAKTSREAGVSVTEVNKMQHSSHRLVNALSGEFTRPVDATLDTTARILRNWKLMSTGGGFVLYNMIDAANMTARLAGISKTPLAWAYGNLTKRVREGLPESERGRIFRLLGLEADAFHGHIAERLAPLDIQGERASGTMLGKVEIATRKGARALMELTGMDATTNGLRRGGAIIYLNEIGRLVEAGSTWDQLAKDNPLLHLRMTETGFDAKSWRQLSKEALVTIGQGKDRLVMFDPDKLGDKGKTLLAFLDRESHFMVSSPDLYTRSLSMVGNAGTAGAVAWRLAMMYKSFGIGMMRQTAAGAYREGGPVKFAKLAAGLTGMAALKIQMDQIVTGEDFYDLESPVLWTKALDQSGMMWVIGSAVAQGTRANVTGQSITLKGLISDQLAGPVIADIMKAGEVSRSWASDWYNDGVLDDKTIARTLELTLGNVPYQNVLYWRWAVESEIRHGFIDSFDPAGARRRRRARRLEREAP